MGTGVFIISFLYVYPHPLVYVCVCISISVNANFNIWFVIGNCSFAIDIEKNEVSNVGGKFVYKLVLIWFNSTRLGKCLSKANSVW